MRTLEDIGIVLFIVVAVALTVIGTGCERKPGTDSGKQERVEKKTRKLKIALDRPLPAAPGAPGYAETTVAEDGAVNVKIPAGTKFELDIGDASELMSRSEFTSIVDKFYSTPWWVYGIGAAILALSCALAWVCKSPLFAVLGAVVGGAWVTVFVLIQFYTWMFLVLALVFIAAMCVAGWYLWDSTESRDALGVLTTAIETAPEGVRPIVKGQVAKVAKDKGIFEKVQDKIREIKKGQ